MNVRAHVFVQGKVQGVFFRSEAAELAHEYRVKGWIRNLPDGRVEALFEGEEKDVKKLIEFCMTGPRLAVVTKIDVLWEDYEAEFSSFAFH